MRKICEIIQNDLTEINNNIELLNENTIEGLEHPNISFSLNLTLIQQNLHELKSHSDYFPNICNLNPTAYHTLNDNAIYDVYKNVDSHGANPFSLKYYDVPEAEMQNQIDSFK